MKLGRKYAAAVFAGLLIAATQSQAAGFDCSKAATAVEKMICADEELSKLDSQMSKLYKPEGESADFQRAIQRRWLKQRNQCTDADCLRTAYAARLRELQFKPLDADDDISGIYSMGSPDGYQGYVEVVLLSSERLRYFLNITSGPPSWHTAEAHGEAVLKGKRATTIAGSGNCKLVLRFDQGKLKTTYGKGNDKPGDCPAGAMASHEAEFQ